jgi:hypothetical protein
LLVVALALALVAIAAAYSWRYRGNLNPLDVPHAITFNQQPYHDTEGVESWNVAVDEAYPFFRPWGAPVPGNHDRLVRVGSAPWPDRSLWVEASRATSPPSDLWVERWDGHFYYLFHVTGASLPTDAPPP